MNTPSDTPSEAADSETVLELQQLVANLSSELENALLRIAQLEEKHAEVTGIEQLKSGFKFGHWQTVDGNAMIFIPKLYVKNESENGLIKRYISNVKKTGFHCHPAFMQSGHETPTGILISKYLAKGTQAAPVSTEKGKIEMKIFINAGHSPDGKPDPGACGNNLRECDVVLKIGRRVENYLKAAGLEVKFLQLDGLTAIANAANQWNADYFVSIHCNSYNTQANGTETYCYAKGTTAEKLVNAIHARILKTFPELTNRGVKTASYSVLRNTKMPDLRYILEINKTRDKKKLLP